MVSGKGKFGKSNTFCYPCHGCGQCRSKALPGTERSEPAKANAEGKGIGQLRKFWIYLRKKTFNKVAMFRKEKSKDEVLHYQESSISVYSSVGAENCPHCYPSYDCPWWAWLLFPYGGKICDRCVSNVQSYHIRILCFCASIRDVWNVTHGLFHGSALGRSMRWRGCAEVTLAGMRWPVYIGWDVSGKVH